MTHTLTIFEALQHLFPGPPEGEAFPRAYHLPGFPLRVGPLISDTARATYGLPPLYPFDSFAITGYLLERSGAYHHVASARLGYIEPLSEGGIRRLLTVDQRMIKRCRRVAKNWRQDPGAARADHAHGLLRIYELWSGLFGYARPRTRLPAIERDGRAAGVVAACAGAVHHL